MPPRPRSGRRYLAGRRLFATGLVTAAGIMAGFVWIDEDYSVWMGLIGGADSSRRNQPMSS